MDALYNYLGGSQGTWRVTKIDTLSGAPLKAVSHMEIVPGPLERLPLRTAWVLKGVVSNTRYVTREERLQLESKQPPLNRPDATLAAMIPIRKTAQWWNLAQDERREMLAVRSRHIETGLRYLPAIARRLLHGRDLGEQFDFLTWFEYAPQDSAAFDDLLATLRATAEWSYVEREIDLRLVRT